MSTIIAAIKWSKNYISSSLLTVHTPSFYIHSNKKALIRCFKLDCSHIYISLARIYISHHTSSLKTQKKSRYISNPSFFLSSSKKMLGRFLAKRLTQQQRSFSKYVADTYGVKQHRLAKKAGIEVEPVEVVAYFMGAAILVSDVSF